MYAHGMHLQIWGAEEDKVTCDSRVAAAVWERKRSRDVNSVELDTLEYVGWMEEIIAVIAILLSSALRYRAHSAPEILKRREIVWIYAGKFWHGHACWTKFLCLPNTMPAGVLLQWWKLECWLRGGLEGYMWNGRKRQAWEFAYIHAWYTNAGFRSWFWVWRTLRVVGLLCLWSWKLSSVVEALSLRISGEYCKCYVYDIEHCFH
jgi:hypothetical protein